MRTDLERRYPLWVDALAVVAVLAPVLLLAKHLRPVISNLGWHLRLGAEIPLAVPATEGSRIALWAAVTATVLLGWRLVAALGASVAVLGEVVLLAVRQPTYPTTALLAMWPLLLSVIAATVLTVAVRVRPGTTVLGARGTALTGVAATVAVAGPTAEHLFVDGNAIRVEHGALVALLTYVAASAIVLAAVAGTAAPVRRRILALLAPIATLLAVINLGFDRPFSGAIYVLPPILAPPVQWLLLAAAPPLVLAASVALVRRREGADHRPAASGAGGLR